MKVASLQSKLLWGIMGEGLMFQLFKYVQFRWTKLLQPALICPHSHCWIFLSFSVWKSHSEKKIKDNHVWAFRKCMKCIFILLASRSAYVGCMSSYSTPHHIVETTVSQWISVWLRVLHCPSRSFILSCQYLCLSPLIGLRTSRQQAWLSGRGPPV